jgi:hypothetical protein
MSEEPEGMISVEEFGKRKGIAPSKVIDMIRDGFYVGRKSGEEWFINSSESANPASSSSKAKGSAIMGGNVLLNEVVVTDIKMSFISMVIFMVKWVVASIPALIILFVIFTVIAAVFGGVVGGLSGSRY